MGACFERAQKSCSSLAIALESKLKEWRLACLLKECPSALEYRVRSYMGIAKRSALCKGCQIRIVLQERRQFRYNPGLVVPVLPHQRLGSGRSNQLTAFPRVLARARLCMSHTSLGTDEANRLGRRHYCQRQLELQLDTKFRIRALVHQKK